VTPPGISVRGTLSFWIEYDEINDADPRKLEVRDVAFALTQEGEGIEDAVGEQYWWGGRVG
jgi:hypothetical protein